MDFKELDLAPALQQAIDDLGYQKCTEIQEKVIPSLLKGLDVAGLSQTGTGKTAAFLIPLINRILRATAQPPQEENAFTQWRPLNFILILVPTRELAEQCYENIVKLTRHSNLQAIQVYGGTGYDKQKEAFRQGVQFVVATPGRLIDLFKDHVIDLKQVRAIVFDEADRMFDMGFKDDMKFILQRVPRERQFLVFSATLNFDVLNTAYQFGAQPVEIDISRDKAVAEFVEDEIFHVGHDDKPKYLLSLTKKYQPKQMIVFSNFKVNVDRLARFLSNNGFPAMGISSLLSQAQRNKVLEQFRTENNMNILVATDVAARGLDIKGVDMVINYELPMDAESYIHRIGRTGRAGVMGKAFSLVSDRDVESLSRVEDYIKEKLPIGWIEDSELLTEFQPVPPEFGRSNPPHRGGHDRSERKPGGPGAGHGKDRGQRRTPGGEPSHRGPRRNDDNRSSGKPQNTGQAKGPQSKHVTHGSSAQPEHRPRHEAKKHSSPRQEGRSHARRDVPRKNPKAAPTRVPVVAQKGFLKKIIGFFSRFLGAAKNR